MSIDWRTATTDEKQDEIRRIAGEMGDHKFFTGKEMRHLPDLLGEGEQVFGIVSGFMDNETWVVALTDQRILMLDTNMFIGKNQRSIGLDKVNTIEVDSGLVTGRIYIEDANDRHEIRNVMKGAAEKFVLKTREVMERRRVGSHGYDAPPASRDPAHERIATLERLDALRRSGGLTEDEYAREKAKLLG